MRSSTLTISLAVAGALALPQTELKKRQAVTVVETVTVTTTVSGNPYATPAWKGAPKFLGAPDRGGPDGDPPKWTPPRLGQGRPTIAPDPGPSFATEISSSSQAASATLVSSYAASVAPGMTSFSSAVSSDTVSSASPSVTDAFSSIVASASATNIVSSSTIVVGNPISNTPVPSSDIPVPTGGAAPLDPGHISGTAQAGLTPADGEDYINAILFHHNQARANHGADPLVWNATVADTAAITANTCVFAHYIPNGAGQGQNIFTTSGPIFNVTAGITESWYKREFQAMFPYFGEPSLSDDVFHEVGHLTQVLWKGTASVGCTSVDCGADMTIGGQASNLNKYTVCNYYPAGNVATLYADNVGFPISTTDLGSWSD
ncbi:hypothetical protein G6514_006848 [Epicoccum nigrum]|nr:hypothetical protein G6514_006848 [Epicoccum nigrum]